MLAFYIVTQHGSLMEFILNTLRLRQNGHHFPDYIFKSIFLNENVWISINISLKFVPKGPINNIPALDQIMTWRQLGDKPLSEPMMVSLLTHKCITRRQWLKAETIPQTAKTLGSTLIRSDAKVMDWYLTDVDLRVFVKWDAFHS